MEVSSCGLTPQIQQIMALSFLSADFLKIHFIKKLFQEHYQSVKQLWIQIRTDIHSVSPDLGPNCLQRLSADDKLPQASKELNVISRWLIDQE